ncbi:MAG: hypothetical protein MJA27_21425 [Pseudanabaenales cyanobacterium]|nr:hypothetical protein [Pseudanabaenales cyanobacterium]
MSFQALSSDLARYREQGGDGPRPITGTAPVAGKFYRICAASGGCTLSALVISGKSDDWNGFVLAPDQCLLAGSGRLITSITLSAGAAYGYEDAS